MLAGKKNKGRKNLELIFARFACCYFTSSETSHESNNKFPVYVAYVSSG